MRYHNNRPYPSSYSFLSGFEDERINLKESAIKAIKNYDYISFSNRIDDLFRNETGSDIPEDRQLHINDSLIPLMELEVGVFNNDAKRDFRVAFGENSVFNLALKNGGATDTSEFMVAVAKRYFSPESKKIDPNLDINSIMDTALSNGNGYSKSGFFEKNKMLLSLIAVGIFGSIVYTRSK